MREGKEMTTNISTIELFKHKFKKITVPIMAGINRKKLNNCDFTIISNNCWGGYAMNTLIYPRIVQR